MYTLDYISTFSMADSLEFQNLPELVDYINDTLAENESIRIKSKEWKGYIGTYPGICTETGEYRTAHQTILGKYFEGCDTRGLYGNLPKDAIEIIRQIGG